MASCFNRFILVTIAGALASLGACDCGTTPPSGVARIAASFASGTPIVESDGVSVLQISLTATTAENTPDVAPISVTAPSGGVAARGASDFATSLSGNPTAAGTLDLDFRCEMQFVGAVALAVDNGTVSTTVSVRCIEPRGDVVIDVTDTDCEELAADGESTCRVQLKVERRGTVTIPLPGTLEATVLQATPTTSGEAAVLRLLSLDGASTPAETVTVLIDENGDGAYYVHAPEVAETAEVELVSSGVTVVWGHVIEPFTNQAAVEFPNGGLTIAGGRAGTLVIDVTDPSGDPASSVSNPEDVLDIIIEGGADATRPTLTAGGQGPLPELTGVTITDGKVDLQVNTQAVTSVEVYTVRVSYQPLQRRDPIEQTVSVTVTPPWSCCSRSRPRRPRSTRTRSTRRSCAPPSRSTSPSTTTPPPTAASP